MKINDIEVEICEFEGKPRYKYFACTCKVEDEVYWKTQLDTFLEGTEQKYATTAIVYELRV